MNLRDLIDGIHTEIHAGGPGSGPHKQFGSTASKLLNEIDTNGRGYVAVHSYDRRGIRAVIKLRDKGLVSVKSVGGGNVSSEPVVASLNPVVMNLRILG